MTVQKQITLWQTIRRYLRQGKRALEAASQPVYWFRGYPPNGFGYYWRKQHEIKRVLNGDAFDSDKLVKGYGIGIDERVVEFPWLLSRIPKQEGRVLDAGSAINHRLLLDHPSMLNKDITISTLAPENDAWWRRGISYVYEDFRSSCFRDGYFDLIVCVSTLEHVGLNNTLLYTNDSSKHENSETDACLVMREFKRMLRPGGKLYLTFPFGEHKNFGWFQIFDADGVRSLSEAFKPTAQRDCYYGYAIDGWYATSQENLKEAGYFDPQTSDGSPPDGAAGARGLACLEWTA